MPVPQPLNWNRVGGDFTGFMSGNSREGSNVGMGAFLEGCECEANVCTVQMGNGRIMAICLARGKSTLLGMGTACRRQGERLESAAWNFWSGVNEFAGCAVVGGAAWGDGLERRAA